MRGLIRTASACAFALVLTLIVGHQTPAAAQGVGFGFKVGPSFAKFTTDLDIDRDTGWTGGFFIGGNRDGVLGWQTEINWLRRQGTATETDDDFRIDYIQVPIFLRLNLGTNSKNGFAFYGIFGPAFEIKVADELNGVTIDDSFEGTDVGIIAGGGIEITRLIFEARYEWGLMKINNTFSSTEEIKSRSFTVLVGIRFN